MNDTSTAVSEKALECDFSFSVSRDHVVNETTIVGHVGKDAEMTFVSPGKYNPVYQLSKLFILVKKFKSESIEVQLLNKV